MDWEISIHAPRGGSDLGVGVVLLAAHTDFNPRSPWGERQLAGFFQQGRGLFQSTLPVGGATQMVTALA